MLTDQQLAHFSTFGFLFLKQAFSPKEMAAFTAAAEELWRQDPTPGENGERRLDYFVERRPPLTRLLTDDRIYAVIQSLLGEEFVWVGSEGNICNQREINWHPDRKYYRSGEEERIHFPQVKVMLYLQKVGKDSGCLRVIPGSHRMPYHKDLAQQEVDPESSPFGLVTKDIPCHALESEPGDVIFFNHCLWHSVSGGTKGRSYIGLKFAAKPLVEDHLVSLQSYTPGIFRTHEALLNSTEPRIRSMVENLADYAADRIEG
jgi:hypothetical protein